MTEHEQAVIEWALDYARWQRAIDCGLPVHNNKRWAEKHLLEACAALDSEAEGHWAPQPNGNGTDLHRFHNALRILTNIDRYEFVGAGLDPESWPSFRTDPYRHLIRASAADAARLWQLIEERQS